jgi:hypothetical protein
MQKSNNHLQTTAFQSAYLTMFSCASDLSRLTSWKILVYSFVASSLSDSMSSICFTAMSSPVFVSPRNTCQGTELVASAQHGRRCKTHCSKGSASKSVSFLPNYGFILRRGSVYCFSQNAAFIRLKVPGRFHGLHNEL